MAHLESHHAEGIPVAQRWAGTQLLNFFHDFCSDFNITPNLLSCKAVSPWMGQTVRRIPGHRWREKCGQMSTAPQGTVRWGRSCKIADTDALKTACLNCPILQHFVLDWCICYSLMYLLLRTGLDEHSSHGDHGQTAVVQLSGELQLTLSRILEATQPLLLMVFYFVRGLLLYREECTTMCRLRDSFGDVPSALT